MTATPDPHLAGAIKTLADGQLPGADTLEPAFEALLAGAASPEHIAAFLMGLRCIGETEDVLVAGARVMRRHARRIVIDGPLLDTCGTGGLPWVSLNTSTASAILVAACGGRVAKHGNRSVPPKTGSADVLEALGVALDIDEATFRACLEGCGVGFLFARAHHSAMRHVAPVRQSLGIRTVFNLLGPLTNPAGASHQILGVYSQDLIRPMASALQRLGTRRALIVHGLDGIDEISISGPTRVCEIDGDSLKSWEMTPEDAGFSRHPLASLTGGTAQENARAIGELFEGRPGPFRDMVCLNAGAGLHLLGLAPNIGEGAVLAAAAIDSGAAQATLARLAALSHGRTQ